MIASRRYVPSSNAALLPRRMTGVGGRPEVVLEGSMSPAGPWREYHFPYKPGDVARPPKFWCV